MLTAIATLILMQMQTPAEQFFNEYKELASETLVNQYSTNFTEEEIAEFKNKQKSLKERLDKAGVPTSVIVKGDAKAYENFLETSRASAELKLFSGIRVADENVTKAYATGDLDIGTVSRYYGKILYNIVHEFICNRVADKNSIAVVRQIIPDFDIGLLGLRLLASRGFANNFLVEKKFWDDQLDPLNSTAECLDEKGTFDHIKYPYDAAAYSYAHISPDVPYAETLKALQKHDPDNGLYLLIPVAMPSGEDELDFGKIVTGLKKAKYVRSYGAEIVLSYAMNFESGFKFFVSANNIRFPFPIWIENFTSKCLDEAKKLTGDAKRDFLTSILDILDKAWENSYLYDELVTLARLALQVESELLPLLNDELAAEIARKHHRNAAVLVVASQGFSIKDEFIFFCLAGSKRCELNYAKDILVSLPKTMAGMAESLFTKQDYETATNNVKEILTKSSKAKLLKELDDAILNGQYKQYIYRKAALEQ